MKRFSISTLMIVVLVCGVAVAALRDASDTWAGVLLGLTLLMLGIALIGVLHRRGTRRAFWQGFALFGWGYLALTTGPWASEQIGPRLPTTHLLDFAHGRLNPQTEVFVDSPVLIMPAAKATGSPAAGQLVASSSGRPATLVKTGIEVSNRKGFTFIAVGNRDQFVRVGHCLFALLAALVGGLIARWFRRTNREPAA